ncbi:NADH dehydrogenase [ubiquinone] 1 alpha subcomplex subunit 13-B [Quillaja saponaria]|uniref:NADH dehydrogenase [ubiquinone] 1 alpha subcomplex subunit 13 n=1 Tax=Quillaja saponaria TaxID=32244 RepID=A0AAD7PHR3_QUISA|nr:NADH dehydrogenase [ubiquinone] 1 alpha subcomplex subunit 13-B [Quillaja saponaria]
MLVGSPIRVPVQSRYSSLHLVLSLGACTRALKEEKYAARRAILPVIQAEEDERFVKEWKQYLQYEAEVMQYVPGWKVGESVYNSGRWVPPSSGELRPEVW